MKTVGRGEAALAATRPTPMLHAAASLAAGLPFRPRLVVLASGGPASVGGEGLDESGGRFVYFLVF